MVRVSGAGLFDRLLEGQRIAMPSFLFASDMSKTNSNPTKTFRYRWANNHGSVLAGLACVISIFGFGFIAYRQSRLVKPKFPDGSLIDTPSINSVEAGGGEIDQPAGGAAGSGDRTKSTITDVENTDFQAADSE